jgi:uncharacterized tellurite resistance protein B-like protein
MSLASLKRFFGDTLSSPAAAPADREEAVRTATAAILLDIAYADDSFSMAEEARLLEFLRGRFGLSEEHARDLLETADSIRARTIDHWNLTNTIRSSVPLSDRIEIVRTMWRLVYTDTDLHQYENYLVRKLADLLGIEHHVMIEAKMSVRSELGLG